MNKDFNYIKEGAFEKKNHLLEQFTGNKIEKAISEAEFNEKYGKETHESFTMKGLNDFVAAATENGATEEIVKSIQDEFATLTEVIVKSEAGYTKKFVRELVKSGESTEETPEGEMEGSEETPEGEESTEEAVSEEGSEEAPAEEE